jgi:drug/metabolite transporter (DMT)-like permease
MVVAPLVIALLLAAALMHATWNALLKADRSDRLATFGVIMTTGTVMGLVAVPFLPMIEFAAWKFLATSVIVHVAYYTFLLKAYSYGDLSHTYPIARGLGPMLVALVSGQLIGEHLRVQDIVGVVLLSMGLVALALPLKGVVSASGGRHGLATLFAVLTGVTIAAYIIADGLGVRSAGPTFEHRLAYIAWLCVLEGPWLLVLAIVLRPQTVWKHLRRYWWRGAIGGVIANTGYGIAIYALVLGPMAHVAALRETSVLFGALMGTLLLGEPFGRRRVVAAAVIVSGLLLMNGPQLL